MLFYWHQASFWLFCDGHLLMMVPRLLDCYLVLGIQGRRDYCYFHCRLVLPDRLWLAHLKLFLSLGLNYLLSVTRHLMMISDSLTMKPIFCAQLLYYWILSSSRPSFCVIIIYSCQTEVAMPLENRNQCASFGSHQLASLTVSDHLSFLFRRTFVLSISKLLWALNVSHFNSMHFCKTCLAMVFLLYSYRNHRPRRCFSRCFIIRADMPQYQHQWLLLRQFV